MPIAEIQLPDGSVAEIEVPEGATEQQILAFAEKELPAQLASFKAGPMMRQAAGAGIEAAGQLALTDNPDPMQNQQPASTLSSEQLEALGPAPDPTRDMSGTERFIAGYGGVLPELARGTKQRMAEKGNRKILAQILSPQQQMTLGYAGHGDRLQQKVIPDEDLAAINKEVADARRFDAPLMNTAGGKSGKIVGTIANTLPLMFMPGANTYTGAAATGAGLGYLQPTVEGESAGKNAIEGGAYGLAGKALADTLAYALRTGWTGIKAATAPFREAGRNEIAAKTIKAFAANPDDVAARMASAKEIIPGSKPTTADIAQDAGISQLQRTMALDPQLADDFAQRALDRNSARLGALDTVTKHADDLEGAVARRADIGKEVYKKALGQKVRVDGKLNSLTERPSFQKALDRARTIAADEGAPLKNLFDQEGKFASVRGLHYIKMGYDDLINAAPQSGIGKAELQAIRNARGELLEWMGTNNPAYKAAMTRFEKASRPINRQEVVNALKSRATGNQVANTRGELTVFPAAYGRAIKDKGGNLVQNVTGRYGETLDDVMRPEQMAIIQNVLKDAAQESAGLNMGRAVGSNTAQNLAGMNVLREVAGAARIPQAWAERNVFPTGARMMNLIYGGQEPMIKEAIAEALLNPQRTAELLNRLTPQQQKQMLAAELMRALPVPTGAAIGVSGDR
jgi:hypothetical protein